MKISKPLLTFFHVLTAHPICLVLMSSAQESQPVHVWKDFDQAYRVWYKTQKEVRHSFNGAYMKNEEETETAICKMCVYRDQLQKYANALMDYGITKEDIQTHIYNLKQDMKTKA